MLLSQTEENYIKAIYQLHESEEGSVSTNAIAEILQTKPASVSDMIKKLATKELAVYKKYKGVKLSETGEKAALRIIRKHRLWEVFLVEKLKFQWDEVHEIAEQLEHIQSPLLISKLDEFLGFPTSDPHGDPIPSEEGIIISSPDKPLNKLSIKDAGIVTGVNDSSTLFLQHLNNIGIQLSTHIEVIDIMKYDLSMQIKIDQQHLLLVSEEVCKKINIRTA